MTAARLGVVIVNYKRPDDTIECLETLLRSTAPLKVVVVDNASGDGSAEALRAWADGTRPPTAASPALANLSRPPLAKPLAMASVGLTEVGGTAPARLTLIESPDNLGFAGGNNLGLRHLLADPAIDYFWLLNNDTVVAADAAAALVQTMDATPRIGQCGTEVRFYWRPDTLQCRGGARFSMLTGQSRGLDAGKNIASPYDVIDIVDGMDFVLGASLAVSRAFLQTVGPMHPDYFLYYEEIDWAMRNRRRAGGALAIGYAFGATVWHKEGGSIGSSGAAGARSPLSDYWLTRSRLRFVRRFAPLLLPWHWLLTLGLALRRLTRRQPAKAGAVLRALFGRAY